jgi:Protein of unknown function (DUF2924)
MGREWSVVRDMANAPKSSARPVTPETVAAEIEALTGLSVAGLRAAWQAEFGKAPPKGLWRDLLLRSLAWRLQEKAFGGHDKATRRLLDGDGGDKRRPAGEGKLNQRLKTGTVLVRDFNGTRHTVTLVPEGFIWQENTYSSLSAIAKVITGTNWNGPRFFGLRETPKIGANQTRAA